MIAYNSSENEYSALIITKQRSNEKLADLEKIVQEVGPFSSQEELVEEIKSMIGG